MAAKSERVFQFKIVLKNTKPPIWRRIQVPGDYTFWDLHVAIQDSMGWTDTHLHEFEIFNFRKRNMEHIGIPDDEFPSGQETLPGWKVSIAQLFTSTNPKAEYSYDFGDGWEHTVLLEKSLRQGEGVKYPRCIAGRRRCPPEDCGGPWGYEEFLKAISDPKHEEHASTLEWVGGSYDPDDFDPGAVTFDDPNKRLKYALQEQ